MYVPAPAPWHSLHQRHTEVVKRNGNLHPHIERVLVVVPQQHHLIVVREIIVGDRYPRGPHYRVDQPVGAVAQRAVIHPYLLRAEYGDPVTVRLAPVPDVGRRRGDHRVPRGLAVVDVDVVDDDVGHVLEREAAVAGDFDVGAAAVDGFVAVDDELVFELDEHVGGEGDPDGFRLDDGVAEGARRGVRRVAVGGVGDDVDLATFAAEGALGEADAAVG